ncbi:zinc finger protein CONSTANS-LIKE 9-like [Brassica napus]|nr:zinc finger protein CONSTANS-LIKE 9-like [Brassica napus]
MFGFNDDITSPLSAQIFEFCDPQLFQETFNQSSEVTSTSNILDKSGSGHGNNSGNSNTNTTTTTENSNTYTNNKFQDDEDDNINADMSTIFDSHEDFENDIVASIDFSSSSMQYPALDHLLTKTNEDQFDFAPGVQAVHQLPNISYSGDTLTLPHVPSLAPLPLPLEVFEEDCLSSVPSYNIGLNPTSPFFRTSGLPTYMVNMNTSLLSSDSNSGLYPGYVHPGSEFNKPYDQLLDFQADNGGLFRFNPDDLQALNSIEDQSHLVVPQTHPPLGPVEVTGLEDSTLNKVVKLSSEQRKEKIHRYMKKRNERNFGKKIKYACRKTLADSRPRVRGRFAKNDEFGELHKHGSSSHHYEEDEDGVGVKDEEQLLDSSDIFAHISGPNSFKCNYPIQYWT